MVILITGKQGAGKTHYARELITELEATGFNVCWIDGDAWRGEHKNDDYSEEGRKRNLLSAAQQAAEYERGGHYVVLSFIAPKRKWRDAMRKYWHESRLVYMPGGKLWEGTEYETPVENEFNREINKYR